MTWAFAAAVALINPGGLYPLALPPLAVAEFAPWGAFLRSPLIVAAVAAFVALLMRRSALVTNAVFWVVFFSAAEVWRGITMGAAMPASASCSETHSFLRSLTFARHEYQFDVHAAAIADGRVMLWSYRDMDFFEIGANTYRNLDFVKCRDAVNALPSEDKTQ